MATLSVPLIRGLALAVVTSLLLWPSPAATAADWPQYRGNAARDGHTDEALPTALTRHWIYRATHAPRPAWSGRDTRMPFDRAFHPIVAGNTLFFGSSADCKLYALDAATGRERWSFVTDGPIRFAPAVWRDTVFAASDDGYLYCLSAADGSLRWKRRGGPRDDRVLGNDRMVSRWPVRGGPVVCGENLYFGAGLWPAEGVYVYALDPASGAVKWQNDSTGALDIEQPHGGNRAMSGASIQGYLAADSHRLFVPTGRAVPAVFDRATGKLLYFHLAFNSGRGGSEIVVAPELFLNGGAAFGLTEGQPLKGVSVTAPGLTAVFSRGLVKADQQGVSGHQLVKGEITDRTGETETGLKLENLWTIAAEHRGSALVVAGSTIVSGGKRGVSATSSASPPTAVWSAATEGEVFGLAVASGRLFVSTDQGVFYCFGDGPPPNPVAVTEPKLTDDPGVLQAVDRAAAEILVRTGITEGYCVDLACGDGSLAYALAKRSQLQIYAVDGDPAMVALARQRLDQAGLYGVRVTVLHESPEKTTLPNRFANLAVSGRSLAESSGRTLQKETLRLLRPYGGIACTGKRGAMRTVTRGALKGAGAWTHQYADAANTICSDDALARSPLGMLWFTDFGFQMPSRHGRGPAPLFKDGMLVVEGVDGLLGVDAYNGRIVWRYPIPGILAAYDQEHLLGTAGTQSNLCADDTSVFVRHENTCLRLDLKTGKKTGEYRVPGGGIWGYVAVSGDSLFGTRADNDYVPRFLYGKSNMSSMLTQSTVLFALDPATGKTKWLYPAGQSIRHNAIALDADRIFLIDMTPIDADRLVRLGQQPEIKSTLVCLDARTGRRLWDDNRDIYGTMLALSTRHDVLLMGYQYSQRTFQFGSEKGHRLTGFRASGGRRLWDVTLEDKNRYLSRPMINGRTIYAQPHAWDLLTGQSLDSVQSAVEVPFLRRFFHQEPTPHPIGRGRQPGGCGNVSGSKYLLLYRSGPLGYTDLSQPWKGTQSYGPMRPGCWINAIAAGGLVLMPDATDRCTCSYLMKVSVALQPMP